MNARTVFVKRAARLNGGVSLMDLAILTSGRIACQRRSPVGGGLVLLAWFPCQSAKVLGLPFRLDDNADGTEVKLMAGLRLNNGLRAARAERNLSQRELAD
jgi:hypothetical protein